MINQLTNHFLLKKCYFSLNIFVIDPIAASLVRALHPWTLHVSVAQNLITKGIINPIPGGYLCTLAGGGAKLP